MLSLDDGRSVARIAPEFGGTVTAFWSRRGQDVLHWFHPVPDELIGRTQVPKGGMFVLAPFSNRIEGARFDFRGTSYGLEPHPDAPAGRPHAAHGYGNRRPWRIARQTAAGVTLTLDDLGEAWPWRVAMVQELALEAGALVSRLEITNRDSRPMPAGGGFHPFFTRTGGQRLVTDSATNWRTDELTRPVEPIPTGATPSVPLDVALDPLTMHRFLGDWSGSATITFPSLEAQVRIEADPAQLPYLLLFCPPGRPVVCVEPVSHMTGAFQLPEAAAVERGLRVLEPGETLSLVMRLTPLCG